MVSDPFAFCPACKSDSFHLTKNCYSCDDCHFTFFLNAATAVAGILVHEDRILFTVREKPPAKGKLGLPGGFVDFDESMEEALRRETREELGIEVKQWQYLTSSPNVYDYANVRYRTCDGFFVAELKKKPELTLQASEITSVKWLKRSQIKMNDIAFESMRKAIKLYLAQTKAKQELLEKESPQ